MKKPEIALLFGGDDSDAYSYKLTKKEHDRIMEILRDIKRLKADGFLNIFSKGPMKHTYVLSWQGIDLIAAYHATIPVYLKKFSQWPQESFKQENFDLFRDSLDDNYSFFDSHCYYKQRWVTLRPDHQIFCKEFGAALLCGARSLKSEYGFGVEVSGLTTISIKRRIRFISGSAQRE